MHNAKTINVFKNISNLTEKYHQQNEISSLNLVRLTECQKVYCSTRPENENTSPIF